MDISEEGDLVPYSHDSYFKKVFSDTQRAEQFFREHLPAALVLKIEWPSLSLIPGSFVKQSLRQAHSDLLFSAQISGVACRLYLLFEHQTQVDERMPMRILNYVQDILNQHESSHGLPLPHVLPFVLHQGPDRWTVSNCFEDLFALPDRLRPLLLPYLPKFSHLLLDLSQYSPAEEERDSVNRVSLELMRQLRRKLLAGFFLWLQKQELPPRELLLASLLYAWNNESSLDLEHIAHTLEDQTELKETAMTLFEKLIATGEAKGEARGEVRGEARGLGKGRAEGEARGRLKGLQHIMKLPVSSDEELAGLDIAELERRYEALERQYDSQFKKW